MKRSKTRLDYEKLLHTLFSLNYRRNYRDCLKLLTSNFFCDMIPIERNYTRIDADQ